MCVITATLMSARVEERARRIGDVLSQGRHTDATVSVRPMQFGIKVSSPTDQLCHGQSHKIHVSTQGTLQ